MANGSQKDNPRDNLMTRNPGLITITLVSLFFLFVCSAMGEEKRVVQVLRLEGPISPVAADRLDKALRIASQEKAQCLVIKLDTPGGLDKSMRQMVKAIMNSQVPVVVYVSPKGARAASAGVFITLASHIAAMAPGTNIGAAHPVAMGVGGVNKTMEEKIVNDASAYIKSIAQKRKRNVEWAEKAVRESVSITDEEALKLGVIDLIAEDMQDLLGKLDERRINLDHTVAVLKTVGAHLRFMGMTFREKVLQTLADPNIAYILLMIGIWGIILEFFHPGIFLPGIAGSISLILAFFSLQILPFNLAGLLLIILAIILFVLEINVPSYGALTIGGIIALTLGSLMLISPSAVYISISLTYIITMVVATSSLFIFVVFYAIRAQFKKPATGLEGMIGTTGVARSNLNPRGKIQIHGEIWNGVVQLKEEVIKKGEEVEVVKIEGMRLVVKKKEV